MAIMVGSIHQPAVPLSLTSNPLKWLGNKFYNAFTSSRHNPSPFPDRVWSRHSALLDSAWKQSLRNRG